MSRTQYTKLGPYHYICHPDAAADHGNASTRGSLKYLINLLGSYGGGIIEIIEGNYPVTNAVLVNFGNIEIRGMGDASLISLNQSVTYKNAFIISQNNVYLRNFRLNGSASKIWTSDLHLIGISSCSNCVIDSILCTQHAHSFVKISNGNKNIVQNCKVQGGYRGILNETSLYTNVIGCDIKSQTDTIYDFNSVSSLVRGNTLYIEGENQGSSVVIVNYGEKHSYILNSFVQNSDSNYIAGNQSIFSLLDSKFCMLGNNTLRGRCSGYEGAQEYIGVRVQGSNGESDGNFIIGNTIISSENTGGGVTGQMTRGVHFTSDSWSTTPNIFYMNAMKDMATIPPHKDDHDPGSKNLIKYYYNGTEYPIL